jgi:hypothetical protein
MGYKLNILSQPEFALIEARGGTESINLHPYLPQPSLLLLVLLIYLLTHTIRI